jgi:hypothetical protein
LIKNNAGKINKVKQSNNRVKDVRAKTPLVEVFHSSPATAPEKRLILLVDVGDQRSLCVVNDQPVGNPKRKV